MARNAAVSIENNFTGGLVTDSTGLNFPENACTDVANVVFDRSGAFSRRLGFDFEQEYVTDSQDRTNSALVTYLWKAAAGDGDNNIVVQQIGQQLQFYLVSDAPLSTGFLDQISLGSFADGSDGDDFEVLECQFTSGLGYLFVAHPLVNSFYVVYDPDTQTLEATQIDLAIRDFEGVEDGLEITERPSVLSEAHEYNLHNQGWNLVEHTGIPSGSSQPSLLDFPLQLWEDDRSDYPSNCDVVFLYKNASDHYQHALPNQDYGNSPAPKGHFILPFYDQDRNAVDIKDSSRSITGLDVVSSGFNRASTIAFFSGRVWYSGVQASGYSNKILFSQIIERDSQIGQCYQQNDPTSEYVFDLLPSDGGVILIPDAGTIVKLFAMESSLLIFATNGVWSVTGSEGIGFRANDYSVSKLSSIPAITSSSFIDVDGMPAWWNSEGIHVVSPDQTLGNIGVQSLSDKKIADFFETIPEGSKRRARGAYNSLTKEIHWLYKSEETGDVEDDFSFDRLLTLNKLNGAFSVWTVDISDVSLHGVVVIPADRVVVGEEATVTDSLGATVTDSALETVTARPLESSIEVSSVFYYFVSYNTAPTTWQTTFAVTSDGSYKDWYRFDDEGVSYDSYVTTGYKLRGDAQRKFQPTYFYLFSDNEDTGPTVVDVQGRWGFATNGSTGRWSGTQRLTYEGGEYTYEYKRIKIRGHGIVLQVHLSSVEGEPMSLIGWSVFETGNAGV